MNGQSQGNIIGGFVAIIVIWILDAFILPVSNPIPDTVVSAISGLLTLLGGWIVPAKANPAASLLKLVMPGTNKMVKFFKPAPSKSNK
jgi:hypothetical protein